MSDSNTTTKRSSWAVPTKADDELWNRMTREQQLAAYQAHFNGPACSISTDTRVAEIVERLRTKRKTKRAPDDQDL